MITLRTRHRVKLQKVIIPLHSTLRTQNSLVSLHVPGFTRLRSRFSSRLRTAQATSATSSGSRLSAVRCSRSSIRRAQRIQREQRAENRGMITLRIRHRVKLQKVIIPLHSTLGTQNLTSLHSTLGTQNLTSLHSTLGTQNLTPLHSTLGTLTRT